MDADERERTYGSLATFGFSNAQTAGFNADGHAARPTTGNAYASFLLGELNATNVVAGFAGGDERAVLRLRVVGAGRLQAATRPDAQPRAALRHHEALHRDRTIAGRSSIATLPNPAVGGYPGAVVFAGDGPNSCSCRTPIATYHGGARTARRPGLQPERTHRSLRDRLRHQLFTPRRGRRPRRRAQRHRHARLLGQRELPERERLRSVVQLEQRRAVVSGAALLRSDAEHRLRHRPWHRRRRDLRRSRDRRAAAALSELERRACSTRWRGR